MEEDIYSSDLEHIKKKKTISLHEESNVRPSDSRLQTSLSLSQRGSLTRILHTATISNVENVICVNRQEKFTLFFITFWDSKFTIFLI